MRRRIVLAIVIVAFAAIAGRIYSRVHEGGWRGWHHGEGLGWRYWQHKDGGQSSDHLVALLARRLHLTEGQREQINQIISIERPTLESLNGQLEQASQQLRDANVAGEFDEAEVRQLATQQTQILAELIIVKERIKSKVFALLTPEQRVQANKLLERIGFVSSFQPGVQAGDRDGGIKSC